MIETEKRAPDVEEFSPTEPIYQENVIRHLVRLASVIVIGLLGVNVVQIYLPDFEVYTNILSPMLIFVFILVFLAGIFLGFFQLRWVNEKRNKSTNLGGNMGFFGLFVVFLCSVSSLVALQLVILIPLLVLGLLLTFIGFFAETTRIDEPLVFWFRINFEVIIRYTISVVGVFLVNWSFLSILVLFFVEWGVLTIFVFPGDPFGGLIIGGIGLGLVWGSWFRQINHTVWRYRIEIIRIFELSLGLGFILIILAPFIDSNFFLLSFISGVIGLAIVYLDLYIFKMKVTSHFSKGFVTLGQVFASLIGVLLIIIGLIQALTQSIPDWFFFSISFPMTGLLLFYRVWFDNINYTVKRTIQTVVWFFRTYYREITTTVGVSFLTLGSFLFEFTKLFNPLLMDVLVIDSFFDPLPLGFFLGGFAISVAIWHIPDRHAYFRGVTTTLSITVVLWGILLLGLLLTPPVSPDELSYVISSFLIVMGISINGWIWRIEIYQSFKSILIALKNAIGYTINTTAQFLTTYYRQLITIGALSFTVYGLVVTWNTISAFPYGPFFFLLSGYIVSVAIWYIPDRHSNSRGVTTTLSTVLILYGILLLLSQDLLLILWLSGGLIVIGIVVNGTVWRNELKQLVIKTAIAIKNAFIFTGQAIKNFFIAVKDAFIQTIHMIWYHHIIITRAILTTAGFIVTVTSFISMLGFTIAFVPWMSETLELLFLLFGIVILYIAWFNQVNHFVKESAITIWNTLVLTGHALYNFLIKVKEAVIEALHTIWFYRIVILRAFATILGPLMILVSFVVVPFLEISPEQLQFGIQLVLLIAGLSVLYAAWFYQVNHFVKQSLLAIRNAIVNTAHDIKNFFVTAINALIQAGHSIWEHRIAIIRAIMTISGSIMTSIGLLLLFYRMYDMSLISGLELFLILAGVLLLYVAWFHQVNLAFKQLSIAIRNALVQTANAVHKFLVAVTNSIAAFFQYAWDHRIYILRAVTTITASILILAGLLPPSRELFDFRLVLILGGILLLYLAWFHQVNQFVLQSAITLRNAFQQLMHAIGQALRAFFQFLKDTYNTIVQFFQTYYIEIIRFSTTCLGILSLIVGLVWLQEPLGWLLIGSGLVILYATWFHKVNHFIIHTLQAIWDALLRTVHAIKDAFKRAFYALGDFMRKLGNQLILLFRTTIDLTIPIILILLAISVSFYGVIVLLSGFVDPSGVEISEFFLRIDILGVLAFLASIIQWGTYERNLLGFFANSPFLIPLGAALIVVGIVIFLFVALKKENMRLKSLLSSTDSIESDRGGK
ncbi:MAG: hypothetical protein JSW11_17635 [Candidatus Heimdallarchaeota archaeon]|nr:MAG: hypothetical protein JSW11_17635 [Candidatus Heimdallarchaeota archaeon]